MLDLGADQGQDSRFFAEHGYDVVSTDFEAMALAQSKSKLPDALKQKVTIQKVDLREELPFEAASFDVVYAHLPLHYFDKDAHPPRMKRPSVISRTGKSPSACSTGREESRLLNRRTAPRPLAIRQNARGLLHFTHVLTDVGGQV